MTQYATYPSLKDKVVLITGGAEGIGAACVEMFWHQGSKVVFLDISEPSATKLIASLKTTSEEKSSQQLRYLPEFLQCDVTDLARLQICADEVLKKFGRVDVLLNNAASAGGKPRIPTEQVTPESWDFDVNVNLRHQFFLTQAVIPSMKLQKSGSIINMGSITWRIPASGLPVYTLCKAAIMGMTRTHSKEFGEFGIRVNSVMPGAIATPRQIEEVLTDEYRAEMHKQQSLKRDLVPEEVAALVLFLASEDSRAVTGSSYVVDGGFCSDP
ncbi:NAD(P)-binding protein [Xylariaceae sp. FL0255]|nr:NAD(P)-binding protein [Xylariaceae sp. FL0255]